MEDFAGLMRRLWRGEVVLGHDGPAGTWPVLALDPEFDEQIPLLLSAFGPESLKLAGRAFDAVLLHTFFTDETLHTWYEPCVTKPSGWVATLPPFASGAATPWWVTGCPTTCA